jgi:hypothetical protein
VEVRLNRALVATVVVLGALLIGSGPAIAKTTKSRTQTASARLLGGGTVSATISYSPKEFYAANLHLTISRAGQPLYSAAVDSSECGMTCAVESKAVSVSELTQNSEPVVRLDLYTGGAHCCFVTQFYRFDPGTQTYSEREHDWGDPGYQLRRLGGQEIFETADDQFAYRFTDYAASGLPLELLRFNGTKLVVVTRRYRALIRQNAARYLRAYQAQARYRWDDTVGVIAAWAADEDELGQSALVARYLSAQSAAGHLNSGLPGNAEGARFIRNLDAFLKRTGYLR